ncbi:gamma-glutamyl-gamma-aminobutyrate hydrolase family protein [Hutsoniella sourekii]|uniref:gamma-glutamyl-gamma-aminobutyrate hydrolase family protein n=1 Tax=Hutsoniella sourekii TaxID=87650 RepID=UPI000484B808|nr:gamma-glutamyl-gamma-aminobutyrate hydrolase family protein [Hutsoniella sourekii]
MRPIIGITGNTLSLNRPEDVDSFPVNYSPRSLSRAIERAGGLPLIIPISHRRSSLQYLEIIDGLLLAGGQDVSPLFYGEEPRKILGSTSPERDQFELGLIQAAIDRHKAILGVCRGMQLINVALGGTLYQDIDENADFSIQHVQKSMPHYVTHSIRVEAGSHASQSLPRHLLVNSFHHQAIKDLAPPLKAVAKASDGLIEAIEAVNDQLNILAIQWHPELLFDHDSPSLSLFEDLVHRSKSK